MGYLLCNGVLAKHPYYIEEMGVSIYSSEELCYYICQNIYIISPTFINDSLVEFIRDELKMPESANRIARLIEDRELFSTKLVYLLREFHYYSEQEIKEFRKQFEAVQKMSVGKRLLAQGDYYYTQGRYQSALKSYDSLAKRKDDATISEELMANMYQHLALVYIKMGLYEEAMQNLNKSNDIKENDEVLKQAYFLLELRGIQLPMSISSKIDFEKADLWKTEFEEVKEQEIMKVKSDETMAMFTKDSIRKKAEITRYIGALKKAFRE